MKCQDLLARLSDYVDGDLDRDVYEAFRAHLDGCTPCEVVIDNIRQTITLYRSGQPANLPGELQGHLRRVLRDEWHKHFPGGGT